MEDLMNRDYQFLSVLNLDVALKALHSRFGIQHRLHRGFIANGPNMGDWVMGKHMGEKAVFLVDDRGGPLMYITKDNDNCAYDFLMQTEGAKHLLKMFDKEKIMNRSYVFGESGGEYGEASPFFSSVTMITDGWSRVGVAPYPAKNESTKMILDWSAYSSYHSRSAQDYRGLSTHDEIFT